MTRPASPRGTARIFTASTPPTAKSIDLNAPDRGASAPCRCRAIVQVTNLDNGRTLKLRVNDRGPYARGRIIDVSRRAAQLLGFEGGGTAKVRVRDHPGPRASRQSCWRCTARARIGSSPSRRRCRSRRSRPMRLASAAGRARRRRPAAAAVRAAGAADARARRRLPAAAAAGPGHDAAGAADQRSMSRPAPSPAPRTRSMLKARLAALGNVRVTAARSQRRESLSRAHRPGAAASTRPTSCSTACVGSGAPDARIVVD